MLSREVHYYEHNPIGVRSRLAVWSGGIILAAGAGGPGFNSQNDPVSKF